MKEERLELVTKRSEVGWSTLMLMEKMLLVK